MFKFLRFSVFTTLIFLVFASNAQNIQGIYVDSKGVIRWEKDNKEAAFFGVNYTAPFAYGNRAIKRMGVEPEQAIKDDVYHLSRLGLDAFRVHVWDTEISDAQGNLIDNEHLRLFDFLVAELKKRKIKILITPIAFWGNGYPEKDENTGSFSSKYGKQKALVNEDAFKAQENYLKQFFKHKNPYTGLTYQQDVDVLATEVNNEPQHSGPNERTTEYVNRMVAAIKSSGWTKPIFYNISESPKYADAVVKANVQGHSFQWYPTGLVAGHTLQGNYLPNVSKYEIPFDSIPEFKNRAKIVYEFDAGDVMAPIMYPAMARSFRAAGFQWATQFAYDPMATAYANTEYQTHYLNLAFTPSKAISLLIASKVFHNTKRLDATNGNTFGPFNIDYENSLSEMNTEQEFYYTNNTLSKPLSTEKLIHLAGVGSSKIVAYEGKGAYFLDKISAGVWRLEVMPDAIQIRDPFAKASPEKEVTRINRADLSMDINLSDLGSNFTVKGLNQGNTYSDKANSGNFNISPGTYLLVKQNQKTNLVAQYKFGSILLGEYVAPKSSTEDIFVKHQAYETVSQGVAFKVNTEIVGLQAKDSAFVQLSNSYNRWKTVPLIKTKEYNYVAEIPANLVEAGLVKYQVIIKKANGDYFTFPANKRGNPYAWDSLESAYYQTYVAKKGSILEIFNPNIDGKKIDVYNPNWENNRIDYTSDENPKALNIKLSMDAPKNTSMGFQHFFREEISGRTSEINSFKTLVIKVKSNLENAKMKIGLIDTDANFFSTDILVGKDFKLIEIPLNSLKADAQLVLPRPYPGFLPLYYQSLKQSAFQLNKAEKLEVTVSKNQTDKSISLEIASIYLIN
ncbi:membrane or secreted protein [Pedobacter jejuensis]|uniref:Membrane or secreted protein n=1 Tax=Pedobacter jejuensis TaxID=1268550 RepID=A0A3N0BZH7_9SPHI|nr:membrane or secreted protein [Pedobacter jejuensis]RNL55400.1 membrane or secreted protein [Pedobacter jejuensis]